MDRPHRAAVRDDEHASRRDGRAAIAAERSSDARASSARASRRRPSRPSSAGASGKRSAISASVSPSHVPKRRSRRPGSSRRRRARGAPATISRRLVRAREVARVDGVDRLAVELARRAPAPARGRVSFSGRSDVPLASAARGSSRSRRGGRGGSSSASRSYASEPMDLGLADRVCVVTGSTGGIGLETARLLADEGARVVVARPRRGAGRAGAARSRAPRSASSATSREPGAPEALVAEARRALGPVDVPREQRRARVPGVVRGAHRRAVGRDVAAERDELRARDPRRRCRRCGSAAAARS